MKTSKRAGIWMDHVSAHIIPFSTESAEMETIESDHFVGAGDTASDGDKHLHHKEQNLETGFYKQLAELIKGYDDVLLFGPTDAKLELHNMLRKDSHFEKIKIETETTERMTPNQLHAFVTKYFQREL